MSKLGAGFCTSLAPVSFVHREEDLEFNFCLHRDPVRHFQSWFDVVPPPLIQAHSGFLVMKPLEPFDDFLWESCVDDIAIIKIYYNPQFLSMVYMEGR